MPRRKPPVTLPEVAKMLAAKPIVAYYRVSTDKQGVDGYGIAGQVAAVESFARMNGGSIIQAYKEAESGKRKDRPELAKALARAKRAGAVLCIAKLDRLARNVAFVSNLMESGVDFVAVDNPHANRLTVHILAAVAEDEAKRISDRTKAALAAARAKAAEAVADGEEGAELLKLGAENENCRNLTDEARRKGAKAAGEAVTAKAREAYADLAPMMRELRQQRLSFQGIAERLNDEGHTTRTGSTWRATQVMRVLDRLDG